MHAWNSGGLSTAKSPLATIGWALAATLSAFTIENLWIDPWLRGKSDRFPSLKPEAFGGTWMLVSAIMALIFVLLVVSQILMWKDAASPSWKKALRALGAFISVLLCAAWFESTIGVRAKQVQPPPQKPHTVTLHWHPSVTKGAKYNVYRSLTQGKGYVKLNAQPLTDGSYLDNDVQSGKTYYYITRSISGDKESLNSNEVQVKVP